MIENTEKLLPEFVPILHAIISIYGLFQPVLIWIIGFLLFPRHYYFYFALDGKPWLQ